MNAEEMLTEALKRQWSFIQADDPAAVVGSLSPFREKFKLLFAIVASGAFSMPDPEGMAVVYGFDRPPFAPGEVVANYVENFLACGRRVLLVVTPEQAPRVRERLMKWSA